MFICNFILVRKYIYSELRISHSRGSVFRYTVMEKTATTDGAATASAGGGACGGACGGICASHKKWKNHYTLRRNQFKLSLFDRENKRKLKKKDYVLCFDFFCF